MNQDFKTLISSNYITISLISMMCSYILVLFVYLIESNLVIRMLAFALLAYKFLLHSIQEIMCFIIWRNESPNMPGYIGLHLGVNWGNCNYPISQKHSLIFVYFNLYMVKVHSLNISNQCSMQIIRIMKHGLITTHVIPIVILLKYMSHDVFGCMTHLGFLIWVQPLTQCQLRVSLN